MIVVTDIYLYMVLGLSVLNVVACLVMISTLCRINKKAQNVYHHLDLQYALLNNLVTDRIKEEQPSEVSPAYEGAIQK